MPAVSMASGVFTRDTEPNGHRSFLNPNRPPSVLANTVQTEADGPQTSGLLRQAQNSLSPCRTPGSPRSHTPGRSGNATAQQYRPALTTSFRRYEPNASIALVGFRGTGMSSLAVMASTAMGFRLIDSDQHFYQITGLSRGAYRDRHGVAEYKQEEMRQMRAILSENQTKTVIVCGPGAVEGTGQSLLSEYAKVHPVIHILRNTKGIQNHVSVWDANTTAHFVRLSRPIHRALSSFEFYNLDEISLAGSSDNAARSGQQSPRTLALKKVEEDFLQFLSNVIRNEEKWGKGETGYGLASIQPEARPYSYALSLRLSPLAVTEIDLSDIDTSADVVELIIPVEDMIQGGAALDDSVASHISRQYFVTRRNIRLPVIIHLERDSSSFDKSGDDISATSEQVAFDVLNHALRLAPEYITVDLRYDEQKIRDLISAKGLTKVIGHYVDFAPGASGWSKPERRAAVVRAEAVGCDMVRLCQPATAMEDNFAVRTFIHETKVLGKCQIPVIAYNTEPLGRMSNFLNTVFTPVTHSALRARAPDCSTTSLLTINEAQSALYASFALDPMKFGIYGGNVSQSLSPAMHNAAFKKCGMPHTYEVYNYPTLRELESLIGDPHFGGVSITAPFKRDIIPFVDGMSREAQAIGAINTLLPLRTVNTDPLLKSNRKGPIMSLYGENTDWIGIHTCVRNNLSPINAIRRKTSGLIVGAGGMARAAAYAMIRLGVRNIFVYSRTLKNAEELARQFHGRSFNETSLEGGVHESCEPSTDFGTRDTDSPNSSAPTVTVIKSKDDLWPAEFEYPTIIVSSVPHSKDGKPMDDNTLPTSWLASPTGGVVIELAYLPLVTPLLGQILALDDQGWIAVDGLQVLPEQGTVQFEFFTGRKAPRELMHIVTRQAYRRRLEATKDTIEHGAA